MDTHPAHTGPPSSYCGFLTFMWTRSEWVEVRGCHSQAYIWAHTQKLVPSPFSFCARRLTGLLVFLIFFILQEYIQEMVRSKVRWVVLYMVHPSGAWPIQRPASGTHPLPPIRNRGRRVALTHLHPSALAPINGVFKLFKYTEDFGMLMLIPDGRNKG